jgi:hypothetical protein
MGNGMQKPLPEPQSVNTPDVNEETKPKINKSHKKVWLIIGIILCLLIICIGVFAMLLNNTAAETKPIEAVLDSNMRLMVAKDIESSYAQFSTRARQNFPISNIQEMVEGNNYLLYQGYKELHVESINVNANAQGILASVSGVILYEDGSEGQFNATLEKEAGKWQIVSFQINVPTSKINP